MSPKPGFMRGLSLALLTAAALCSFSQSGWPQANPSQGSALPAGFVRLRDVAPTILQDMRYAGTFNFTANRVPGYDAATCVLWAGAARALQRAQVLLEQEGLRLKVYDCYRPARAVRAFAAWSKSPGAGGLKDIFYPHVEKAKLFQLGYISLQSKHSRGIAVDIGLERADNLATTRIEAAGACDGPSRVVESALDFGDRVRLFFGTECDHAPGHFEGSARQPCQTVERLACTGFQKLRPRMVAL